MKHKDEEPTGLANAVQILSALYEDRIIRIKADRLGKAFEFAPHHVALGATIAETRRRKASAATRSGPYSA